MCTVQLKVERLLWYDNRRGYKAFKAIYIIYEKEEMYPKIRYIAAVTASAAAPSLSWSEDIVMYVLRWAEGSGYLDVIISVNIYIKKTK